jgi:lipoprotein-anchoring transpeptidase ErfK/SrfK
MAIPALSIAPRVSLLAIAAASKGLLLQPALLTAHAGAGSPAGLFVHAPAFAQLSLYVAYPDGQSASYQGKTDGEGRYVFSWLVPADLKHSGAAMLHLTVQRDGRRSAWSGTLAVTAAPLPPLFVHATAPRFLAGTTLGVFVRTAPRATFTYELTAANGTGIARGAASADGQGRYVISAPDSYLPHLAVRVTAIITVQGISGSRTGVARFVLLPRPPLPLRITLAQAAVHAGQPLSISVSSAPKTAIALTITLGDAVVAKTNGVTDAGGRWVFTTTVNTALPRPEAARVSVQASHGIDQASRHVSILLQPGSAGIFDRLADASNPAPDLSNYFTQIPDKLIVVSTESQTLRAYDHGALAHENYVTTGRPELPTPHGVFQVLARYSPFTFISPWPVGSPYYYPPSPVHFAMLFREGGYFLHDAPWRSVYGPGTNLPHSSDPGEPLGTHGCINLPYSDMVWIWDWAPIGTTVLVY